MPVSESAPPDAAPRQGHSTQSRPRCTPAGVATLRMPIGAPSVYGHAPLPEFSARRMARELIAKAVSSRASEFPSRHLPDSALAAGIFCWRQRHGQAALVLVLKLLPVAATRGRSPKGSTPGQVSNETAPRRSVPADGPPSVRLAVRCTVRGVADDSQRSTIRRPRREREICLPARRQGLFLRGSIRPRDAPLVSGRTVQVAPLPFATSWGSECRRAATLASVSAAVACCAG